MQFWSLSGLTPYGLASELQKKLVERRACGEISDTILFLEHSPVVTRGRGLQWVGAPRERSVPLAAPLPASIEFCESERGGDLTYHGPGQLVVYPIVKLDGSGFGPEKDVTSFLRKLEQVFIDWIQELGLRAEARESATGVWVEDKKIASIGIAVRRWVVWHGLALNVVNDLGPFQLISPCGFTPEVMSSLGNLLDSREVRWPRERWRSWCEQRIAQRFAGNTGLAQIQSLTLSEAMDR
ncbi:MAG: lipoyl(octanoyl) transferase LipB [Bdellovibrionales bacterium]|nr:lipoyl(octanoyl) transferase LipB [Bdellovibrionales bacterium]